MRSKQDGDQMNCISETSGLGSAKDLPNGFGPALHSTDLKSDQARERLRSELEAEVIPRIFFAHSAFAARTSEPERAEAASSIARIVQARELTRLAVSCDAMAVVQYVEGIVAEGAPLDRVLVEIVGGAARYMGQLWESDDLDFVEVTIATSRLQQAIRLISADRQPPLLSGSGKPRKAAFVATKGEQHTFGLIMVGEAFRCAGWNVRGFADLNGNELAQMAGSEHIDLAGFSLAAEDRLDQLIEEIDTLRTVSRNPSLAVIVGGNAFLNDPGLWKKTGADGMASDAIEAIRIGDKLVRGGAYRLP